MDMIQKELREIINNTKAPLLARIADLEREVETLKRLAREDKEARLKAIGEPI